MKQKEKITMSPSSFIASQASKQLHHFFFEFDLGLGISSSEKTQPAVYSTNEKKNDTYVPQKPEMEGEKLQSISSDENHLTYPHPQPSSYYNALEFSFSCPVGVCRQKYSNKQDLKRHMTTMHGVVNHSLMKDFKCQELRKSNLFQKKIYNRKTKSDPTSSKKKVYFCTSHQWFQLL